jgi:hypothetical protein
MEWTPAFLLLKIPIGRWVQGMIEFLTDNFDALDPLDTPGAVSDIDAVVVRLTSGAGPQLSART